MVDEIILTEKSKEELIEIILALDRENKELREKVKAEQQKRNEKFAKPNTAKKRRKRPGQKFGHVGITRPVPDHIDEVLEQTLCECPACRHPLSEPVEVLEQIQEDLIARTEALRVRWDKMFANQLSVPEFKALATDSRAFFTQGPAQLGQVNGQLLEIMMAQDFQDLTGQVIKKVVDMVQNIEQQLFSLLLEVIPEDKRTEAATGLINGPVIDATGRADVVTTQSQVDDLLGSLGF